MLSESNARFIRSLFGVLKEVCRPAFASFAATLPSGDPGLSLPEVLDRVRRTRVEVRTARLSDLRYEGDAWFRSRDERFEFSPAALDALCRSVRIPQDLLPELGADLGDQVLRRIHERGRRAAGARELVQLAVNHAGLVVSLAPAGLALLSNEAIVEAVEDAWPDKISAETVAAAQLFLDDTQFELSCYTKQLATEPKVGDILYGGITIQHSQTGIGPTVVLAYVHRRVCGNGMTSRICLGGKACRTRRSHKGAEATLRAVKRQIVQAFYQLHERLDGVQKLLDHRLQVDELPHSLRRRWSINRRVAQQISDAIENDGLVTEYELMNALSWVATHSNDLSIRHRRRLSLAAGMLAQRHIHRCSECGNWLDGRPAAS